MASNLKPVLFIVVRSVVLSKFILQCSYFVYHLAHRSCKVEGTFSCHYQHTVYIIYCQEQIRLVVQHVALLTYGFQVRVHGIPLPHDTTVPRRPRPLIFEASLTNSDTSQ